MTCVNASLVCSRSLVGEVNKTATRLGTVLEIKNGRPKKATKVGTGRYKIFSARAMFYSTLLAET